jgi:predicted acyl esterase
MAWVGRLVDVAPDGSASLITQGWLRGSFRHVDPERSRPGAPYLTDDRSTPVEIGAETEYRMDIWDTAYTLPAGHRLRLWLSSSDTPTHEPLPVAGRNLIFHDDDHPSQLLLSTRPAEPACGADPTKCPPLPAAATAVKKTKCKAKTTRKKAARQRRATHRRTKHHTKRDTRSQPRTRCARQ